MTLKDHLFSELHLDGQNVVPRVAILNYKYYMVKFQINTSDSRKGIINVYSLRCEVKILLPNKHHTHR